MTRADLTDLLLFILLVEAQLAVLDPDSTPAAAAYQPYLDELLIAATDGVEAN